MIIILKGIKYRLYPTKKQEQFFLQEVGNQRYIWNSFLAINIEQYKKDKMFNFYNSMAKFLVDKKKEFEFLKLGNSQCLQQTLKSLDKALKNCFKLKFGFPKFKKKFQRDSFCVPQYFKFTSRRIKIPKIGSIKYNKHIELEGIPKNLTISNSNGKWYCSVCIEFQPEILFKTGSKVGIDLGVKKLVYPSTGEPIEPFKDKKLEFKIKNKQIQLSRKKKKSNRWKKCKRSLSKLHEKQRNKRQDYLHKVSYNIVKSHDIIVMEDLKIKNMTKSSKGTVENPGKMVKQKSGLNRSILSQGWGILERMLEYKCEWYGKLLIKVNPMYTSQTCSSCGHASKENRKSQSVFECVKCFFKINADRNASINILNLGIV